MPRAKKLPAAPIGDETISMRHAKEALANFRSAKARALKLVAGEEVSKRAALLSLRKHYERLCNDYLRAAPETTYAVWCELVKPELDELAAASNDDAIWDRLTETYERRNHV